MKNSKFPIIGTVSWCLLFISYLLFNRFAIIHYIELIVAFAILIIVPIIIRDYNRFDIFYSLVKPLHVPFGMITVISFYVDQGIFSAILTLPWIFITSLLALSGLLHIVKYKEIQLPFPLLKNVSHLLIVVGSGWLFLHRTGLEILHFSDQIVLLTAIHFHYAAFITPYIIIKTGNVVRRETNTYKTWYQILAIGAMTGIPIIALGITVNQVIEFFGMLVLVMTLIGFSIFQLLIGNKYIKSSRIKGMLSLAIFCIIAGMVFSFLYGLGHLSTIPQYIISVDAMVVTHGILNSIGFSLFGVLACLQLNEKGIK